MLEIGETLSAPGYRLKSADYCEILASAASCDALESITSADLCLVGLPLVSGEIDDAVRSLKLASPDIRIVFLVEDTFQDQLAAPTLLDPGDVIP